MIDYAFHFFIPSQWEENQRKQKCEEALVAFGETSAQPAAPADDGLPFACLICREPWTSSSNPVVTKCEHYFCEKCALAHFTKTWRCFVCAEQTGGIFNAAKNIREKIQLRDTQVLALVPRDRYRQTEADSATYAHVRIMCCCHCQCTRHHSRGAQGDVDLSLDEPTESTSTYKRQSAR